MEACNSYSWSGLDLSISDVSEVTIDSKEAFPLQETSHPASIITQELMEVMQWLHTACAVEEATLKFSIS